MNAGTAAEHSVPEQESGKTARIARQQRMRVNWLGIAAGSYALDTIVLALFASAGTIERFIPIAYGSAAAVICAGFVAIYLSGVNLRSAEPTLTTEQILIGTVMQLGVVAFAPQIAFPYLANLFTVFAFGVLQLSVRQFALVWAFGAVGAGAVLLWSADRLGIPTATPFELGLMCFYFACILGRCLLLSIYAQQLRYRLNDSRRQLAASLEQIREMATHDELTKIYNRRYLMGRLDQEKSRSDRTSTSFSVAMLDLDNFKLVNDTMGHQTGDEVLRKFAGLVQDAMRDIDTFGRYGGEEFLIILTATPPDQAMHAVERIRAVVEEHDWNAIAPGLGVTFSAGLAVYRSGEAIQHLLHRADSALYEAKHAGRNQVRGDPGAIAASSPAG